MHGIRNLSPNRCLEILDLFIRNRIGGTNQCTFSEKAAYQFNRRRKTAVVCVLLERQTDDTRPFFCDDTQRLTDPSDERITAPVVDLLGFPRVPASLCQTNAPRSSELHPRPPPSSSPSGGTSDPPTFDSRRTTHRSWRAGCNPARKMRAGGTHPGPVDFHCYGSLEQSHG